MWFNCLTKNGFKWEKLLNGLQGSDFNEEKNGLFRSIFQTRVQSLIQKNWERGSVTWQNCMPQDYFPPDKSSCFQQFTSCSESKAELFSYQFGSVSNIYSYKGKLFKQSVTLSLFSCNGKVGHSLSGLVVDSDCKLIKKFIAVLIPFHLEAFHIAFFASEDIYLHSRN